MALTSILCHGRIVIFLGKVSMDLATVGRNGVSGQKGDVAQGLCCGCSRWWRLNLMSEYNECTSSWLLYLPFLSASELLSPSFPGELKSCQYKHMLLDFGLHGRASPKAGHLVQLGKLALPTSIGHRDLLGCESEDGARAFSASRGDYSILRHCEFHPRM